MLLGRRIKSLRKQHGLTQEELGKMINVTKVSISCYENEIRTPTLDTLMELCNAFSIDINYFLGNDHYVKANDLKSGIYMANEEIAFVEEIRRNHSLHDRVMENPKRTVELIKKKLS